MSAGDVVSWLMMKFETLLLGVVFAIVTKVGVARTKVDTGQDQEEFQKYDDIRSQLVQGLGLSRFPDMKHANVSLSEYTRGLELYRKSVEQTESIKQLKKHYQQLQEHQIKPITSNRVYQPTDETSKRQKRSLFEDTTLQFDLSNYNPSAIVTSARFSLNIVKTGSFVDKSNVVGSVVQIVADSDGITVDTQTVNFDISLNSVTIEFDVSSTVQAWIMSPDSNKGFMVRVPGFEVVRSSKSDSSPTLSVETQHYLPQHLRPKRSYFLSTFINKDEEEEGKTDCGKGKGPKRCCRRKMNVNLRKLEGFDFIMQPEEFNAYQCRGRCPPTYNAANEHAVLQSLMHMKSVDHVKKHGGRVKVRRPCCTGSKYEAMDILHLDDNDSSKLKVTHWKNVVVSQCGCA